MSDNKNYKFQLDGLGCAHCAMKIEEKVNELSYVKEANVNFAMKRLVLSTSELLEKDNIKKDVSKIVTEIEPDVVVRDEKENENQKKGFINKKVLSFSMAFILFLVPFLSTLPTGLELSLYFISYVLSGGEVINKAVKNILKGELFDENFLMSIATIGAFIIGEYPEGVAVMLFYQIGEMFQDYAVERSRDSISNLMDIRPDYANLKTESGSQVVSPELVKVGDIILIKAGEKVPLDGRIVEGTSLVDTTALTGESLPKDVFVGDKVLSGYINKSGLLSVLVEKEFKDSTVARILDMVENASNKKAPTEKFITKFAKIYTPAVTMFALLLAIIPPIIMPNESFSDWVYRALIFLVISCPCALVVSIPLGFFGGIGGASKNGVLIKGSNYLESLNLVNTIVYDKTGTLTKGVFQVTDIHGVNCESEELLEYAAYAERFSNHPIALSIGNRYGMEVREEEIKEYSELAGYGVCITWNNNSILAGNSKLMIKEGISFEQNDTIGTMIHVAVNKEYKGYIVISDQIKEDSVETIKKLRSMGIKKQIMLTGDNKKVGEKVAKELGLDEVYTDLLPDMKVDKLEELIKNKNPKEKIMFVGDGINDAPVLALSDVGVAMGGLGSDAAIEASDVVLMTDEPSKLISGFLIAKKTREIVWQNIIFALGVKLLVLVLGAGGHATMWEAVFADVGVALIAVLNAMRAMRFRP